MSFANMQLIKPLKRAIAEIGYETPTPIQEKAIPIVLQNKDLLGCAQTGTGKTAAFALPILQKLKNEQNKTKGKKVIRALIVTPTRELAIQIDDNFSDYGKFTGLKNTVIFGGVKQRPQTEILRKGVDILVATPGRLLDLMGQGFISLKNIDLFVLDEADRMLDMGFINDVKRIIAKLPQKRQSLFFSATMPPPIVKLSNSILTDPVKIEVTPESSTVEAIEQKVYFVNKSDKKQLLKSLLKGNEIESALIFTRTKHGANNLAKFLNKSKISADAIHGNKSQNARQNALNNFKKKEIKVLVATDIAARGIDIDELSHVINYEIPNIPESYVHRIGRTGRAGLEGVAISLCDHEEKAFWKDILKLIKKDVTVVNDHKFLSSKPKLDDLSKSVPSPKSKNSKSNKKRMKVDNGINLGYGKPKNGYAHRRFG